MNKKWKPFPKQELALSLSADSVFEILFGGARGPGKTDAGIQWLHGERIGTSPSGRPEYYIDHPRYRALVLRKNYNDLVDWIDRAKYLFRYSGAKVVGNPAEVRWPSGATFRLGHLKDKQSYENYLGHEYHRLLVEELTLIPQEVYYVKILGSIRSSMPKILKPQVFCTTNPSNQGHAWVYNRFVKPAPPMNIFEGDDGNKRVYIPGTIDDNPILLEDERYIKFLEGLKRTDPNLYKAWRHGDWSVFEGQFFREFDTYMHATKASTPKENVNWVGGADWGYSPRPFVFISGALQSVNYKGVNFSRLWIDDEIVRRQKTPKKLARIIKKRVPNINSFSSLRIDPSAKTKGDDGSISIKDQFSEAGIDFLEANNDRVNGWQAVRDWFSIAPDGLPYMLINERCNKLITNLPMLVYDDTKKDDLDTEGPDDEADALRYMIMHLKWIDAADAEAIPRGGKDAPVGGFTNERDEWDDDE